jgi:hypothetical protein
VGVLWETLTSAFRRMRIRIGDAGWAAVQPARSKLHAGYFRATCWRLRRADELRYAAASLRASWHAASGRRRAAVGVLAVLPFAMASGVTAIVLPTGGDPRAGAPAQERTAADAPAKQNDAGPAPVGPRATRYERAAQATGGAYAASAAEGVAAAPAPAAASEGSGLAGGRRGGDGPRADSGGGGAGGGDSGGGDSGDSPAQGNDRSDGVERRTSAAPAPPTRTHTRRLPAGGGEERFRQSPSPPAAKPPAPQAQAPAAPPVTAVPPVTETAPQETPPETGVEEDSDSDKDGGAGPSERRGPPPDRGGGNDKDEDEEVDP